MKLIITVLFVFCVILLLFGGICLGFIGLSQPSILDNIGGLGVIVAIGLFCFIGLKYFFITKSKNNDTNNIDSDN